MTYSLHPAAEQDIADVIDFYVRKAGPTVAGRFLDEFERVAQLLSERPGAGTPTAKGRREFPLRIFPYSVIYQTLDASIRILVVRHQHRRPNYGRGRK
ncbi:type II toxin-antitoxin system RelE/ParE family toxin [Duganella sp. LX20W]|uniref:Type II toxin-antitoxin system RelE/ParE family toxin n=1 Tax=Rugamonas brunnea TaxID=2758569 RepID=A0A7W2EW36_9BURK|nr:type II toxin-antitoxin system RelE/ParE family toxin [Rugamonas brunnea]MBA5639661.1 type II toxin-antitoxin system RelE/ParE family toxin [Rugamonas brunnea]